MARYTGPVCRICRRETSASKTGEKIKLFLKGDRCLSKKCAVERRGTAPGQKTQGKTRQKISEYGRQLREKQKMRKYYGVHRTSVRELLPRGSSRPRTNRTHVSSAARAPARQRRVPLEPRVVARASAPAGNAPALSRQRPPRQRSVVRGACRRRDHDRRAFEKLDDLPSQRRGCSQPTASGMARTKRSRPDRKGSVASLERANRHSRRRATHRRILLSLSEIPPLDVRSLVPWGDRRITEAATKEPTIP